MVSYARKELLVCHRFGELSEDGCSKQRLVDHADHLHTAHPTSSVTICAIKHSTHSGAHPKSSHSV